MKTLILPGFSEHNKEWTKYLKEKVKLSHTIETIDWEHWKLGGGLKLTKEMQKIRDIVKDEKFNIIAKSVGTMVAMKLLEEYKNKVNKIILCGIPSISEKRIELMASSLEGFNKKNIICFQNSKDPFVSYKDLKKTLTKLNKDIRIIKKPAKNHDYYYYQDFLGFLK